MCECTKCVYHVYIYIYMRNVFTFKVLNVFTWKVLNAFTRSQVHNQNNSRLQVCHSTWAFKTLSMTFSTAWTKPGWSRQETAVSSWNEKKTPSERNETKTQ